MVKEKKIEKLENSAVKLTVTVDKKDVQKGYSSLLEKYSKEIAIKGFRKGKAPASVLERKFGEEVRAEAVGKLIDESFTEIAEDMKEKPLGLATPELEGTPKIEEGKDFTYSVTFDVFPVFEVCEYKGVKAEELQVKIGKAEMDEELKKIQDANSFVVDKKDKKVVKDSIVKIDYCELDEKDNVVEDSLREDFTFTVGLGQNMHKIDDDVIGMKVDEEKIIEKEAPAAPVAESDDKAIVAEPPKKIRLKVKIKSVKLKEIPALDDDLAQDVGEEFKTLDDLKASIKTRLEKECEVLVRGKKIDAIIDTLVEGTPIVLPKSMVKAESEQSWQNWIRQLGGSEDQILPILERNGDTKENIMEKWLPNIEKKLKSGLIVDSLITKESIDLSDKEIEDEIVKQAEEMKLSVEDFKNRFGEQQIKYYLKEEQTKQKLFDFLLENAKITKGAKMSYAELTAPPESSAE